MILISILDLRLWRPLSRTKSLKSAKFDHSITPQQFDTIEKEFPVWLSQLFKYQVKRAITLQKFPVKYKPLNSDYKAWKSATGLHVGFWQATDFLRQSISVWYEASTHTHHIGFPPDLIHPSSQIPVATIARRLEKGDLHYNLPARPLFIPISHSISRNIRRHLAEFLRLHHPTIARQLDSEIFTS